MALARKCWGFSPISYPLLPTSKNIIPSIAIGFKYFVGDLKFRGRRAPVFDGGTNLLYDFRSLLLFKHIATRGLE